MKNDIQNKKTIIIGDIHGMLTELKLLLKKCDWLPGVDRLIFAGDLVDRGPDSSGVVDFAIKHNVSVTIGNHDVKYLKYYKHHVKEKKEKNYKNPMKLVSEKLNTWNSLSDKQLEFLNRQPKIIYIPEYNCYVVHAGVLPDKPIMEQDEQTYMFVRYVHKETMKKLHLGPNFTQPENSIHWSKLYNDPGDIIYGHDVQSLSEPTIRTNKNGGRTIGIDTGACFGGRLTAMVYTKDCKKGKIIQVESNFTCKNFKLVIGSGK